MAVSSLYPVLCYPQHPTITDSDREKEILKNVSAFFLQVCLTHLNYKVQYGVSLSVLNNWAHTYFPLPVVSTEQEILNMRTTRCSRRCCQSSRATQWFGLAANPYPQRFPGIAPSVIGWVSFHSHPFALWQSVLPSASVFSSTFISLLHLRLHLPFRTLDFSLLIVFQKNSKSPGGGGSIWLISSSKGMELVILWPCCPPLSPKNQENKLDNLS